MAKISLQVFNSNSGIVTVVDVRGNYAIGSDLVDVKVMFPCC